MEETSLIDILQQKAQRIRESSLRAIASAQSGHPGGSLSIADILAVLYFGVMEHSPDLPSTRDYLIVSKGHSSPAVYSALAESGYFDLQEFLSGFRKINSKYQGHIDRLKVPGVEVSTGSLGHGLSIAGGLAMGLSLDACQNHVFALLSDGELQEGQTWEAVMSAGHYQLGNLTAIVDRNRIQLDGFTEDTMGLEPLVDKWKSFGWDVSEVNGHDVAELYRVLSASKGRSNAKPHVIIANTIKGKGVSFMEGQVKWHGSPLNEEQLKEALSELMV